MKLIGIEEHLLTREVRDAWNAIGLAARDPGAALHSGEIEGRLLDVADERLALMDETGLDVQVLSLTTPALHDFGPDAVALARRANDAVAAAVARHPGRFEAFATLPVSMPEEAALELDRCVRTLGFRGTMLCGRVGDRNLDHPVFFAHPRERGVVARAGAAAPPYAGRSGQGGILLGFHAGARRCLRLLRTGLALRRGHSVRPPGARRRLRPIAEPAAHPGPLGRTGAVLRRTPVSDGPGIRAGPTQS